MKSILRQKTRPTPLIISEKKEKRRDWIDIFGRRGMDFIDGYEVRGERVVDRKHGGEKSIKGGFPPPEGGIFPLPFAADRRYSRRKFLKDCQKLPGI